jgi:N-acetylmuramoyl-L-alanine amidase
LQPIKSPCSREFFPAFHQSGRRHEGAIKWVVLHDEEAPTARSAARYFQNPGAGGSAHLCVDEKECYRCLDNNTIPWGASSTFGANTHGFHIEQAGFAWWKPADWMRRKRTLERAAYKTALHLHRFGLPVQFVDARDLIHGREGVTTHAEVSRASRIQDPAHKGKYTHSDPGRGYPMRWFMRRVRFYHAELTHPGL